MPQILPLFLTLSSATESKQTQTLAMYAVQQRVFNTAASTENFLLYTLYYIILLLLLLYDWENYFIVIG